MFAVARRNAFWAIVTSNGSSYATGPLSCLSCGVDMGSLYILNTYREPISTAHRTWANRARQLYKNISMLFLFPVKRDLLFTNI